ncbi:sphingosine-1-phosphate lyase-like [Ornithodoros turicata]|uniref:sphingosine-1-phosphate lyase-like n=1 Tax=Ornithodoros turicata TaxID=34597 RepID=UPI0031392977
MSLEYALCKCCLPLLENVYSRINACREYINSEYETTEPWTIAFTTFLITFTVQCLIYRIFYTRGFVPNVKRGFLHWVRNLPVIRNIVKKKLEKHAVDIERSMNKYYANTKFLTQLPSKPWSPDKILGEMKKYLSLSVVDWKKGHVSGGIYTENDSKLEDVMTTAYRWTIRTNPLHSDIFVGVRKMESELIRWCCNLYNGGPNSCGSMTSGGTESILLVCKAYRDYGYYEKGIVCPEMVVPVTAHAGFDKAGQYLRIKVIHIPVDPKTMRVDVKKMRSAITSNTIMLVGSAPQFPHGTIDPIQEIADLGARHHIPMHVDACLGGFLIPFMEDAGFPIPPFDFRLDGVTSISADTHKYGYSPKGSSVIMYSDSVYRHYQYSVATDWPGGVYCTPTMSGSRAGAVSACTWASLLYYGREGYVDATRKIITTTRAIIQETSGIEGLKILGQPDVSVIAYGSDIFDIFRLNDALTHRGWCLNTLQFPSGFHLCVTLLHVSENIADKFVSDLRECVADIMLDPGQPSTGQAAIYGMAQSIPDRSVVEELSCAYIDACYSTRDVQEAE